MSIFHNLMIDLASQTPDSCSGSCFGSCSTTSHIVNDCSLDCTYSCTNESAGDNGGGEVCVICGASCEGTCTFGCGLYKCGVSCNDYSTLAK